MPSHDVFTLDALRSLIRDVLEGKDPAVPLEAATRIADLGLDSLALVAATFLFEERHGVTVAEAPSELWQQGTCADLLAHLNSSLIGASA